MIGAPVATTITCDAWPRASTIAHMRHAGGPSGACTPAQGSHGSDARWLAPAALVAAALALPACWPEPDAGPGPAPNDAGPGRAPCPADELLGSDRDAMFDQWVGAIADLELVSDDGMARLGTTWDEELGRARERFRSACSKPEVHWALRSLGNSFHDAHSWLDLDGPWLFEGLPDVAVGVRLQVEDADGIARLVVAASDEVAVPVGFEVVAVDGVDLLTLELRHREWFWGSSPEGNRDDLARWVTARSPYQGPAPLPDEALTLRLRDPADGAAREATLAWDVADDAWDECGPLVWSCADGNADYQGRTLQMVGVNYCVYDDQQADVAVVRFASFLYPDPRDPFEASCLARRLDGVSYELSPDDLDAMDSTFDLMARDRDELLVHLRAAGVARVLVDVRENAGGGFDPLLPAGFTDVPYAVPAKSVYFAPAFRADPELLRAADVWLMTAEGDLVSDPAERVIDDLLAHPDARFSQRYPFFCQTDACTLDEGVVTPAAGAPLSAVVLTGPGCLSSCDLFVSTMSANGIARVAGEPSGAGDSPFRATLTRALADGTPVHHMLTVGASFHPGSDTPLEGNPVTVDVPVRRTLANRGRYLDAVLTAVGWR